MDIEWCQQGHFNDTKKMQSYPELKAYDCITMGKAKLMFMPLCGEKFKW